MHDEEAQRHGIRETWSAASNGHYLVCELLVRRPDIDLNFASARGWNAAHRVGAPGMRVGSFAHDLL